MTLGAGAQGRLACPFRWGNSRKEGWAKVCAACVGLAGLQAAAEFVIEPCRSENNKQLMMLADLLVFVSPWNTCYV